MLEQRNSKLLSNADKSFNFTFVSCSKRSDLSSLVPGTVFAFNVETEHGTRDLAGSLKVNVIHSNVIYRLLEQIRARITEQMPSLPQEEELGED